MEKVDSAFDQKFDEFMVLLRATYMLDKNLVVALDTESNGKDVRDGRGILHGISMAFEHGGIIHDIYVPLRHLEGVDNVSDDREVLLREFLHNFEGWLVFHNAKFDLVSLSTVGINYTGRFYDTMLMCHLINENLPYEKSLDNCVKMYVKTDDRKKNDEAWNMLVKMLGWENITAVVMEEYARQDAKITLLLYKKIKNRFEKEVPAEYWQHKQDFTRVIIAMEGKGVLVDQKFCARQVDIGKAKMEEIIDRLQINPGSNKDLKRILIDELELPVVKVSPKTGAPSFDKEAMEVYDQILARSDNPTAKDIFAYRGWQKTTSSNHEAYLNFVSKDGRLRPNYKLHGTKTGRMSCYSPNLQQIPRESDKPWNGNVKSAFIAEEGYELWEFDYSQLELRLATAYAKEDSLKQVFLEDRDIFTEMSKAIGFSRQDTKTFVYSVQYGAGIKRISAVMGLTPAQAVKLKETYKESYPGFKKVEAMASIRCKTRGYVTLWSGRRRHFMYKNDEAHKAFNSAIQGGAADIVEMTMVRLFNELHDPYTCRMLLQVHDSVVFEIRKDKVEEMTPRIREIMADVATTVKDEAGEFDVVFKVEGKKWGEKE